MAYVNVDIDLDEIQTDDLVFEICRRIKNDWGRKTLTDKQKGQIKKDLSDLNDAFKMNIDKGIEIKTLDDKMKLEYLTRIFSKYTLPHIQNQLPD